MSAVFWNGSSDASNKNESRKLGSRFFISFLKFGAAIATRRELFHSCYTLARQI